MNLGGWLVLEPFITPALYQRYPGAMDEYTLSTLMAADTTNGGLQQLEQHYDTFIVRVFVVVVVVCELMVWPFRLSKISLRWLVSFDLFAGVDR